MPEKIIVESEVRSRPLSRKLLKKFPDVPVEEIDSIHAFKEPAPITGAKKILALAHFKGEAVKPFPKIRDAINLGDYVFNPISNCHLECTYCILQSYLKNNPVLTLYANTEHYLDAVRELCWANPDRNLRFGTGELSDSLALDTLTELSRIWVPFFGNLENAYLELKTKSNCVDNLLGLEHQGRTVVSFSLAPDSIAKSEELKCASLDERLQAAQRVQRAGYPVGLHFDPLINYSDWENGYRDLISRCAESLDPERLAWVSVGSLRFDAELKAIATERFSRTAIFTGDFIAAPDGKMRYFKKIRIEMYRKMWQWLAEWSDSFPRYLCMEAPWVWESVLQQDSPKAEQIESDLLARLECLR